MKKGKIIPNGVILKSHEMKTVVLLTEKGYNVELIPKSNKQGEKTPDLKIGGLYWEMKSPKGEGKYLIQKTIHRAAHQSQNVIIDLRRIKISQERCLIRIKKEFELSKHLKRIKVITKYQRILDFEK